MMVRMLPAKRKREHVSNRPHLVWPRHRRWVKAHGCSVSGCTVEPIEFCHVRSAANSGTGIKPHDMFGISLCWVHHREQHQIGQRAFADKYKLDLMALAAEFRRTSPDVSMRQSLRLMESKDEGKTAPR